MSAGVIAYRLQRNLVEFYSSPFRRFVRLLFHTTPFPISPATLLFHTSSIVVLCLRFATSFLASDCELHPIFFLRPEIWSLTRPRKFVKTPQPHKHLGVVEYQLGFIWPVSSPPLLWFILSFFAFLLVTHLPA